MTPSQRTSRAAEMAELYRSGLTYPEVGAHFGVGGVAVKRFLLRYAPEHRPRRSGRRRGVGTVPPRLELLARYQAGETLSEIAADIGRSRERVSVLLQRCGEDYSPRRGRPRKEQTT